MLAALLAWAVLNVRNRIRIGLARVQAASIFMAPGRISLKHLAPFKWTKGERAAQRVEAFHALGFTDLGGYALSESPDTRLFLLQHLATGQLGIVMERDAVGTWSDVALFEQEGHPPIYASSVPPAGISSPARAESRRASGTKPGSGSSSFTIGCLWPTLVPAI